LLNAKSPFFYNTETPFYTLDNKPIFKGQDLLQAGKIFTNGNAKILTEYFQFLEGK
jgi:hypothetical protein